MIAADQPTIFPGNVHVVVSSKSDGNVKYGSIDGDQQVASNLSRLADQLQLTVQQVVGIKINYGQDHTYDVIAETSGEGDVDIADKSTWVDCDALVTNASNVGMLLPIADCNAVVLYDQANKVLALAHIGWHAAEANLAEKLLVYLQKNHGTQAKGVLAYISPSIRQDSYYHADAIQRDNPRWKDYIAKSDKGYHMDVFGFTRDQLLAGGILPDNLEVSNVDVAVSDDYYSHFAAKQTGQQTGRYAVLCSLS